MITYKIPNYIFTTINKFLQIKWWSRLMPMNSLSIYIKIILFIILREILYYYHKVHFHILVYTLFYLLEKKTHLN
jgi:hypothetical protein